MVVELKVKDLFIHGWSGHDIVYTIVTYFSPINQPATLIFPGHGPGVFMI